MNGARRVIVFCLLTAVLPTILIVVPLYIRHNLYSDVMYEVAESDVLEIGGEISTVFCQDHTLKMNASFNAYQVHSKPEITNTRKHIRLKKSMRLPDDSLEYWGFFLPKGSTVRLSVCSRYDGSRILIVRGEKNLRTCGLLDHSVRNTPHTTARTKINPFVNQPRKTTEEAPVRIRFEMTFDDEDITLPNSKVETTSITSPSTNLDLENTIAPSIEEPSQDVTVTESSKRSKRSIADINAALEDETDGDDYDIDINQQSDGLKAFRIMRDIARKLNVQKDTPMGKPRTVEESIIGHRLRHARSRSGNNRLLRYRRKAQPVPMPAVQQAHNLDGKVKHGGNAQTKLTGESEGSSDESSFEKELFDCYGADILLTQSFSPSKDCLNATYLLSNHTSMITTTHQVNESGYYYYIFYSDNDLVDNDIHAIFDIYKPTYQLANITKNCINDTSCTFPVTMFSKEIVIVEVLTRDGIEHEGDDLTLLTSICQPRMGVYIIFPMLVLLLILGCAFL